MSIILQVGTLFLTLVTMVSSIRNSKYMKTKVLVENPKCDSEFSGKEIVAGQARSVLQCGSFCSSEADCRRYQFNSKLKQCQLFDSGNNCYVYKDEEVASTVCFRLKSLYDNNNITRCPIGYYGDRCQHVIKECTEGLEYGVILSKTMMSFIRPSNSLPVIEVKCDFQYLKVIIFFRKDNCKEVDFNRTWDEYVSGFGDPYGNYWIGLEVIHSLSQSHPQNRFSISVVLANPKRSYRGYYEFMIANKSEDYRINLLNYTNNSNFPNADTFTSPGYSIDARPFSTYDRDFSSHDCPRRFNGGWWFLDDQNCSLVNLVGRRGTGTSDGNWFWFYNNVRQTNIKRISIKLSRKE